MSEPTWDEVRDRWVANVTWAEKLNGAVGAFLVAHVRLDEDLRQALARCILPEVTVAESHDRLLRYGIAGLTFEQTRSALERFAKDHGLADAKPRLARCRELNELRNAIAHSVLRTDPDALTLDVEPTYVVAPFDRRCRRVTIAELVENRQELWNLGMELGELFARFAYDRATSAQRPDETVTK
ncbi:MAG TPA: hypothetical protein VNQ73_14330 [Ilumatobacter sp.]|nr:hypothetical protein [Ilumatobacter sp.]